MSITVHSNQIYSQHWLYFKTNEKVNNHDVYFMSVSGIASFSFKGNSSNWHHEDLYIIVPLPVNGIPLPPKPDSGDYHAFYRCKNWVIHGSMNSIFNQDHAVNSGHAVNSFNLENPHDIDGSARVKVKIAVRDRDAYLYRVGYKLDLLIHFDRYIANPD